MPNLSMSGVGAVARDEINIIMLLDNSYSMIGVRIAQLNAAMPDIKRSLAEAAAAYNVTVRLRVISFNNVVEWRVGSPESGVAVEDVIWEPLDIAGGTDTASAIREANKALHSQYMGTKALRPVVILLTDGDTTSHPSDYLAAIDEMKAALSGSSGREKVTRIGIGVDDYNAEELRLFASVGRIGSNANQPLVFGITEGDSLGSIIDWVTVSSIAASVTSAGGGEIVLPEPSEMNRPIL